MVSDQEEQQSLDLRSRMLALARDDRVAKQLSGVSCQPSGKAKPVPSTRYPAPCTQYPGETLNHGGTKDG